MASDPAAGGEPRPWLAHYPAGVDWHAAIPAKPVYSLLDDGAARFAARPCIDFLDRRYSYAQVADLARRAARGLADLGVGPAVKVGLFLPNCPYFVILYHAVLRAGGIVVNFNPLYAEPELIHQIEDSETDIMVTLDLASLYDKLAALRGRTRLKRIVVCRMVDILPPPKSWLFALAMRRRVATVRDDDGHTTFRRLVANDGGLAPPAIDPATAIALLQYTGGTTGVPKAAMLTHANIYANAVQSVRWFAEARPGEERVLGVLPLFHVFAMTCVMNGALLTGSAMILLPRFQIEDLIRTIHRKRPTAMPVVPTILTAINGFERLARYDLTSLRYCISGGAPLPLAVRQLFEARSGSRVVEGYGLSESSPVLCCNPPDGRARPGSVGLPYPGTTIEIVALDAPGRLLPAGETGEICARGPQVMAGYWKRPDETAAALRDGRLHTGDVGHLDAEGFLFITDRIKEMINAGGFKIYPRLVEAAIYTHPDVAECAVIGVGDPYRGQTAKAVIVPRPGRSLTGEAMTRHLADRLSPIEMPKLYEFRAVLPKTAIGKIDKKVLLAEHAAAADRDQESQGQ